MLLCVLLYVCASDLKLIHLPSNIFLYFFYFQIYFHIISHMYMIYTYIHIIYFHLVKFTVKSKTELRICDKSMSYVCELLIVNRQITTEINRRKKMCTIRKSLFSILCFFPRHFYMKLLM